MRRHATVSGGAPRQVVRVRRTHRKAPKPMNRCAVTRLLLPGFLVGLGVSALTGNDLYGWIAGALTVAGLAIVQRLGGTSAPCALAPPRAEPGTNVGQDVDHGSRPAVAEPTDAPTSSGEAQG